MITCEVGVQVMLHDGCAAPLLKYTVHGVGLSIERERDGAGPQGACDGALIEHAAQVQEALQVAHVREGHACCAREPPRGCMALKNP